MLQCVAACCSVLQCVGVKLGASSPLALFPPLILVSSHLLSLLALSLCPALLSLARSLSFSLALRCTLSEIDPVPASCSLPCIPLPPSPQKQILLSWNLKAPGRLDTHFLHIIHHFGDLRRVRHHLSVCVCVCVCVYVCVCVCMYV